MSLLEQKRLQWAKEKAQMKAEWNPWGRPGCGAPLSMENGTATRKPLLDWSSTTKPRPISPDSTKIRTEAPFSNIKDQDTNFKDEKKEDQELNHHNEIDFTYQKSLNVNNSLNLQPSEGRQTPGSLSPAFSVSLPLGSHTSVSALESTDTGPLQRSFLRGANIPLDPDLRAELELKRRKQKEQQLAIQSQLEEKQKRKLEEKERIRREEAKEEEQFIQMNQRLHQQQLQEEEQRIKKFTPVIPQAQVTNASDAQCNGDLAQSKRVQSIPTSVEATVDSASILPKSGLSDINTDVNKVIIEIPRVVSPYISNRLLTPTKYRGTDTYLPRDCGTQTDAFLFNKKDVAIDTDKEIPDSIKRRSKSDGKSNKQNKERDHEAKHRPKWGAHQSQKAYQRQSDKEVAYRRLEEMRQKRLKDEALIQLNQPQVGNGRTRSSARHQRYLLARETTSPISVSSSYRNPSPRLLTHQSSTESTYDSNTESSIIRRQRRQWDSPRGDELPNFYTQPLAGRRNSRSQSSQSVGLDTPDIRSPVKITRDISPSAPGISTWNSAIDLYQHSEPIYKHRFHNSLENMRIVANNDNKLLQVRHNGGRSDAWSTQSMPIDRYSLDFVPYSRSSVILGDGTARSAPFVHNRILQQLSTIRQGLLMKQKEMEHFLSAGREYSLPDKAYGT